MAATKSAVLPRSQPMPTRAQRKWSQLIVATEGRIRFMQCLFVVIPEGNLLLSLPLFARQPQPHPPATNGSGHNSSWRPKVASAACNAFLLSFPKGICFCLCFCFPVILSHTHPRPSEAPQMVVARKARVRCMQCFFVVIPEGNLLFAFCFILSQFHPRPEGAVTTVRDAHSARLLHAMPCSC